jgi:hypothetical protein
MLAKEPADQIGDFYTNFRTKRMLCRLLRQSFPEKEEHMLVFGSFCKNVDVPGVLSIFWPKRTGHSMGRCSLLEWRFSLMSQNQRCTPCLQILGVSEEEREEHRSVLMAFREQKDRNILEQFFGSTDIEG